MQSPTSPRSNGKMRSARQRPNSRHGATPNRPPTSVRSPRKVFNCIVDESALVAGVKRSTRNGIRHWVKAGQIRLFIPLHALEQLNLQKSSNNRHGEDVRETLQWIDEATDLYPNVVTLQGADETYETWPEVERFAVPRTLFSEDDGMDDFEPELDPEVDDPLHNNVHRLSLEDDMPRTPPSSAGSIPHRSQTPSSIRSQISIHSAHSPPTSPSKPVLSPAPKISNLVAPGLSGGTVPMRLQQLFNYILWRIHQEVDPVAALESFIFLCNDDTKVNYAKGFEIKTKRLEQLRDAIGREDRDYRNRQNLLNRESSSVKDPISPPAQRLFMEDTDDVTNPRSPPRAPAAMLSKQPVAANGKVLDPNAFGRATTPLSATPLADAAPQSPTVRNTVPVQSGRGSNQHGHNARGSGRGAHRGGSRGQGNTSGRGGSAGVKHEKNKSEPVLLDGIQLAGQIDPDSFARPRGAGYAGRGGRKLWTPS